MGVHDFGGSVRDGMEEKLRRLCWKTLRAGFRSNLVANIVDEVE